MSRNSPQPPSGAESALNPLQRRVWFLSGLGVLLDGFDLFIIGVALPLITVQFALGDFDKGMVGAAAVLGAVVGAARWRVAAAADAIPPPRCQKASA